MGKLVQTEIEGAHLVLKHKPLKSAFLNLKEHLKPFFSVANKALAKVFSIKTEEVEVAKMKESEPTTQAPTPPATKAADKSAEKDGTHLSKPTSAVERRRAFMQSKRAKKRRPRPLSLRESWKNKLRELESHGEEEMLELGNKSDHPEASVVSGCSCKCPSAQRRRAAHRRLATRCSDHIRSDNSPPMRCATPLNRNPPHPPDVSIGILNEFLDLHNLASRLTFRRTTKTSVPAQLRSSEVQIFRQFMPALEIYQFVLSCICSGLHRYRRLPKPRKVSLEDSPYDDRNIDNLYLSPDERNNPSGRREFPDGIQYAPSERLNAK
uniref:Uncharacterized protein n=1 Tax=Anopheles farauti TaxID=69004 RepID=A0A182Q4X6_9DIPT